MKSILLTVAAFILFVPIQAQAQFADWEINHFHSEITVNADGSLLVQEIIVADFGIQQKHGIFRFVPIVYKTLTGDRQRIDIEFTVIEMDNADVPYTTYLSGGNTVVQMGDPNRTISGEHVYEVYYTVERALLYFDDYDELYWNVTGSENEAEILGSSAVVHLPEGAVAEQYACYVGVLGSTDSCGFAQEGDALVFTADDEMTIAVGFTKGIVPEPTWQDRLIWIMQDNWTGILPLLVFLATLIYWFFTGRDPKLDKTIIAQYDAPKDLWAGHAGLLDRGMLHKRDIVAMIIDLAVRGYLKIEVKGTKSVTHTFVRLKQSDKLDASHAYLYNRIFVKAELRANFSDVRKRMGPKVTQTLQKKLKMDLVRLGYSPKKTWVHGKVMTGAGVTMIFLPFFLWFIMGTIGVVMSVVSGVGILVLSLFAAKVTKDGAEQVWYLQGLKLFLKKAERYRIQWLEKEHELVALLPYAIAFGMTKYWAKAFAALHVGDTADLGFLNTPAMSIAALEGSLKSLTNAVAVASSTPNVPHTGGGSSGGGFSGGGFGGGGSGSW
jgi:hypothetical protein